MHIYPLLVIVAGLLSTSRGGVVNRTETYNICSGSRYNNLSITPASDPFIIRSQGVGVDNYDNNMECSLVLQSGTDPMVLSLEFSEFYLEYNPMFGIDWLCVNGILFSGPTFNGASFNYILPGGRDFTVHFHTDDSVPESGFQIYVTASPLAEGQTVDQATSRVSDIPVAQYHWISFVNATYYPGIPYSDGCAQYLPTATTSPSTDTDDDNEISTTTEEAPTPTEEAATPTEDPAISLEETTHETTANATIPASIPVIYNICDSYGPVLVNVGPNSEPFFIRSPNFGNGGLYSNNLNCILSFISGDEPVVLSFHASAFNLELNYDTLCVNGVRFTGSWFAERTSSFILPEHSTSAVRFLTDSSVTYTGFNIQVTVRRADNETVYQIVGIGSGPESVALVATTYHPGMAYSDGCLLPPQPAGDYGIYTTTDDTTTVETTQEFDYNTTSTSIPVIYNICDSSGPVLVNVGPNSDPFYIRSPNFGNGGLYSNNLNCTLLLTSGDEPVVLSFYVR